MVKVRTKAQRVALHILGQHGPMSIGKLQSLLYYAQAWSLAMNGAPLFDEPIYAHASGPWTRSVSAEWLASWRKAMSRAARKFKALKRRCLRWTRQQIRRRGGEARMRTLNIPGGWSDRDAAAQMWGLAHGGMLR